MAKSKTLRPIRPNAGVEAAYRRALDKMVLQMSRSFEYWIKAAYRANPPRLEKEIAEDALPSEAIARRIRSLTRQWQTRFDDMADQVAERFVKSSARSTDSAFQSALKDSGWTVDFKVTPVVRDVMSAAVIENVSLIQSIPSKYATEVEGIVMRGYTRGRDLEYITSEIEKRYGIARRRAINIARDQSNKMNAVVTRARRVELELYDSEWAHSGAGKEPRVSHVKAGKDKLKFDIREGAYIDGEWILPGEKPGCRCLSRVVLPF